MKRIKSLLLVLLFIVIAAPCETSEAASAANTGEKTVWVCGGPNSKRYHRHPGCAGLKRCSKTPSKISISEAQRRGYTPCKKCY